MKTILSVVAVLFLGTILTAQVNIDSLWQVGRAVTTPDTVRLLALNRLSYAYANTDPDSARLAAQTQLELAREKGLLNWQARALNNIGLSYRYQSDYPQALRHYERSIALLGKTGDRNILSAVYGNMGDVYRLQSNFPKAIDCISKCLALAEQSGDQKMVADAYVSIATIYYDEAGYDEKAVEYLKKALDVYKKLDSPQGLSLVYGNLSAVYLDRGELSLALEYNEKSMAIQKKLGNTSGLATSLHNRAIIRTEQGLYEEALADFNREIAIFQNLGDQEGLADAYNNMGDLWIEQGRFAQAIQTCTEALRIARAIGGSNLREMHACHCLYEAHKGKGSYPAALRYLEEFLGVKDSLQQNETAKRLKEMELQRESALDSLQRAQEQFQLEMAHQEAIRHKDRTMGVLMVVGLGVLVVALAFWVRMLYFRKRSQQLQVRSDALEKQQLLHEVALLRTQVNPHFLFNSLSILSSLVRVDADLSEQFIEQLSRSYRYLLEQKEEPLVALRTELEFIQSYSFLLKIRFENKFDVQTEIPEEMLDACKIAPLTLQLLIENAVKHNRMSAKEPLLVTVTVAEGPVLLVKNRLQPRATKVRSTGVGLQNITTRYALLTDRPVWVGEEDGCFVVKVPLL